MICVLAAVVKNIKNVIGTDIHSLFFAMGFLTLPGSMMRRL